MNADWDIHSAKIIQVPADGLCMHHCVHAANELEWMKNRNKSGMSLDDRREKEDTARAQALKKQFVAYFITKGKLEAAKRLSVPGSEGCPTTDEIPYLAEMHD